MVRESINVQTNTVKSFPDGMVHWIAAVSVLTMGHYLDNKSIVLLALVGTLLYFILMNINKKMEFLFFLIPWSHIMKIEPGSKTWFTYITIILLLAVAVKSKFSFGKIRLLSVITIIVFLLLQKLIISEMIGLNEVALIATLATFSFSMVKWRDEIKWDEIAVAFVCGLAISILAGFILVKLPQMAGFFKVRYSLKNTSVGLRFTGLQLDPNTFGSQAIIGFLIGVIIASQKSIKYGHGASILLAAMSLVIFIAGFLTSSKAYLLSAILSVFLYISFLIKERKTKRALKIVLTAAAIMTAGFTQGWLEAVIVRYSSRFSYIEDLNTFSSGRLGLWWIYLKTMGSRPWVLISGTTLDSIGLYYAAHNTFFQTLMRLGPFSLMVLVLYFKDLYNTSIASINVAEGKTMAYTRWLPLFVYCFYAMSLDLLFKNEFFYILWLGSYIAAGLKPSQVTLNDKV